jgi:hypothetical protein
LQIRGSAALLAPAPSKALGEPCTHSAGRPHRMLHAGLVCPAWRGYSTTPCPAGNGLQPPGTGYGGTHVPLFIYLGRLSCRHGTCSLPGYDEQVQQVQQAQ